MRHTRSSAEVEIREPVVERLRELLPGCRIVHEMCIAGQGSRRLDVAAITKTAIVGVEIKSEKDDLSRLREQWLAFTETCHHTIVVAHAKHFTDVRFYGRVLDHPLFNDWSHRDSVWHYPRHGAEWSFDLTRLQRMQPKPSALLNALWGSELRVECERHGLSGAARRTCPEMIRDMAWNMTGRQVCEAACRQLRQHPFPEADPPIFETPAKAEVTP